MISSLRGELLHKSADKLIVDVGGVGYGVNFCGSGSVLPDVGEEIFVHTYLNVREDSLNLFGFIAIEEKEMFTTLILVSGIGPKVALNILASIVPSELALAIRSEDLLRLTKLPGIGKKTAERLCLELKDKVQSFVQADSVMVAGAALGGVATDVVSALVNLGYQQNKAQDAVQSLSQQFQKDAPEPSFEEFVRLALRSLS